MSDVIENKVAKSGLITLDLEEMSPDWKLVGIDLKDYLWEGLVLKEKEFRATISEMDWSTYSDSHVFIHCSSEAIIPTWAYMLLAKALRGNCLSSFVGTEEELRKALWVNFIHDLPIDGYQDARLIIKGCSDNQIPEHVYHLLSTRLIPVVKSLMFGEPCSTVPVFKK